MTHPQTVVEIQGHLGDGPWTEVTCQNEAIAKHYLAQLAARRNQDLRYDDRLMCYRIGVTIYDLILVEVLDLDQVNELGDEHEPHRHPLRRPRTQTSLEPHNTSCRT